MEPGYAEGLVVAVLLCGILVLWCFLAKKGYDKKLHNLLSDLPQEMVEQLTHTGYVACEDNPNFMYGISYIYEIKQKNGGVDIKVVYYQPPDNPKDTSYRLDYLYMNQSEYNSKKSQIRVGMLIKTIHNRTSMPYKICKIEL